MIKVKSVFCSAVLVDLYNDKRWENLGSVQHINTFHYVHIYREFFLSVNG